LNSSRHCGHTDKCWATCSTSGGSGAIDGEIAEIVGNVVVNIFTNYFNRVALPTIDFPEVEPAAQPV
jgi:hypothetical protein